MSISNKQDFSKILKLDLIDKEKSEKMPADLIVNLALEDFVFNYDRLVFI
jgi:hypothetical protein